MDNIKSIQDNSITLVKPSSEYILERQTIKEKMTALKGDIDRLQLALDGRKADLLYYKGLLAQMPKEEIASVTEKPLEIIE